MLTFQVDLFPPLCISSSLNERQAVIDIACIAWCMICMCLSNFRSLQIVSVPFGCTT